MPILAGSEEACLFVFYDLSWGKHKEKWLEKLKKPEGNPEIRDEGYSNILRVCGLLAHTGVKSHNKD